MSITNVPVTTADEHEALLNKLRDLIPEAFRDGELDATSLLQVLDAGPALKPAFAFSWPGIERARADARSATTATLVPDVEASLHWKDARDTLIEGDNLQVLKLLKNGYAGQVKLVYVDPPYNTGDTFTYNDDFAVPESQYLQETGQVDEQGNATTSRIETGGRKHAPWLTMMFPRLTLARHMLRRDGVIMLSVDNNEVHHLRILLDAVFGPENFVDMMTWRGARKGDAKLTGGGADYILVYARDRSYLKANDVRWRERKEGLEPVYLQAEQLLTEHNNDYDAATAGLREWYRSLPEEDPSKAHAHYSVIDERGVFFPGDIASPNPRPNLIFEWKGYAIPTNGWRYELAAMERLDADNRLLYPDSKEKRIQVKRYLKEHEEWAPASVFYKDRRSASGALKSLMGAKVFDDPKSTDVLARLIHATTGNGDLILDFFAGSGSTGHAVWQQNPKDGKTRHWVLVQIPEVPDSSEESGKNAIAAGYSTIFEVTAERLRRSAALLQEGTLGSEQLGFRIFRTRETRLLVEKPIVATPEMTGQTYLEQVLDHSAKSPVIEGAIPLDVAWEVALKATDTRLDARVETHDIDGVTTYEFLPTDKPDASGRLLISLDEFSLATADALSLSDDDTLILRGDKVQDAVTLTLAPRLQSKLILLERVPREVSL
ncbi:site-specific DNA-methyltransferase [Arthrobacter bambusae]|uniref:site-specific DNA-methyltransferase n=1 Tax=Arthrobacter bambusae TaxID=1338426 RepID=UPI00278A15B0|nr:site-specific DNA-methyltransferase [Arthrobacter bambusae]MDQ0212892.1 adenine-specific DNA-methyltransferase [Arthrobacter bambusae]MDQ0237198.1 adenine-specific DNA-methyltransferase [Arthrobacter bambusae]